MKDHIKPTLLHIRENKQPNDKIYVYNGNIAPYLYYEKEFHLQSNPKIIGEHPRDVKKVVAQFNELEGRVWFVFSHLSYRPVVDSLFSKIEKIGPLDRYESPGCYTFLVDFNKSKSNE